MYVDPIEGTSEEAGEPYVCRVHGSVCDYDAQDVFESHCWDNPQFVSRVDVFRSDIASLFFEIKLYVVHDHVPGVHVNMPFVLRTFSYNQQKVTVSVQLTLHVLQHLALPHMISCPSGTKQQSTSWDTNTA